jgi:uncharacterized protein YbaR (Trm112 family)
MDLTSVRCLCCPQCSAALIDTTDDRLDCSGCSLSYPVRDGVPVVLIGEATEQAITSELVRGWPKRVGSVNQWADATDVLDRPSVLPRLRTFYTPSSAAAGAGEQVGDGEHREYPAAPAM